MNVLLFVPTTRQNAPSLESINAIIPGPCAVDTLFCRTHNTHNDRWDNVTAKYTYARAVALAGGYDYLFCVEDDIIAPPDALARLLALNAPVAYGLTVTRPKPHHWALHTETREDGSYTTFTTAQRTREAWGQTVDVVGCGLYCTLIDRATLAAVEFTRRGLHCCDYYFAMDCYNRGIAQRADCSVVCGHMVNERVAVWPTPDGYEARPIYG